MKYYFDLWHEADEYFSFLNYSKTFWEKSWHEKLWTLKLSKMRCKRKAELWLWVKFSKVSLKGRDAAPECQLATYTNRSYNRSEHLNTTLASASATLLWYIFFSQRPSLLEVMPWLLCAPVSLQLWWYIIKYRAFCKGCHLENDVKLEYRAKALQ